MTLGLDPRTGPTLVGPFNLDRGLLAGLVSGSSSSSSVAVLVLFLLLQLLLGAAGLDLDCTLPAAAALTPFPGVATSDVGVVAATDALRFLSSRRLFVVGLLPLAGLLFFSSALLVGSFACGCRECLRSKNRT